MHWSIVLSPQDERLIMNLAMAFSSRRHFAPASGLRRQDTFDLSGQAFVMVVFFV